MTGASWEPHQMKPERGRGMNPVPELTREQRMDGLEKAMAARNTRSAYRKLMKAGDVTPAQAMVAPQAQRMTVRYWLESLPGIGSARAELIMDSVGVSRSRRVQGLGHRQRERLLEVLEGFYG